jgi:hypothetical protein
MPKRAARRLGGATSAMYAPAVEKLDDVMPERIRPTKSHARSGATAITM